MTELLEKRERLSIRANSGAGEECELPDAKAMVGAASACRLRAQVRNHQVRNRWS